ncbi:hypothetical protein GOP47_0009982 [Adiantum capillus-veneris]|uniref:Uncharacterized protein n=1 Tax=Adiantum capillus-veneris TaxID=13818 RepID=A0A9D4UXW4_ADICA|nr:hypothetical protein GOP47_0009982 [Adiantum capillus-veneris]
MAICYVLSENSTFLRALGLAQNSESACSPGTLSFSLYLYLILISMQRDSCKIQSDHILDTHSTTSWKKGAVVEMNERVWVWWGVGDEEMAREEWRGLRS